MAKNWALVIGINGYNPLNFSPLRYAKQDAEQVKAFFEEMGFDEVCYFADDAPPLLLPNGHVIPTQPTYGNLITFLQDRFEHPFLTAGDNCWFFFAGHGERHRDRDYLMPIDANSRGEEVIAGLPVNYVRERLCRSGADNVILLLDACRSQGSRNGAGIGQEVQQGVITLASCSPTQRAWEIEELGQGAFTHALLEALRLQGEQSCATVERLSAYLKRRVPELCRQYGKVPEQIPRISVDPLEKQHFILLPQHALAADITVLKKDAYQAETHNLNLARQLWIRVLAAGVDMEAVAALERMQQGQGTQAQTAPAGVDRPRSGPTIPVLTANRRQMLKWLGLGGVGITLAAFSHRWLVQDAKQPASSSSGGWGAAENSGTGGGDAPDAQGWDSDGWDSPESSPTRSPAAAVDYSKLESLLKRQQWKQANEETQQLMMQSAGWSRDELISARDFGALPCDAIATLDQLWRTHSRDRFGFSIQQKIYLEGAATQDFEYNEADWSNFGDRVGWRQNGEWIRYSDLRFDLTAPVGHLPCLEGTPYWGVLDSGNDLRFVLDHFLIWFFERMIGCKA